MHRAEMLGSIRSITTRRAAISCVPADTQEEYHKRMDGMRSGRGAGAGASTGKNVAVRWFTHSLAASFGRCMHRTRCIQGG